MSNLYSEMKDTKIEWLKEIPLHWKVQKLKYLFKNLDSYRIPLSSEERGSMVNKVYDYYGASGVIDKVENYIFDEPLILIGEDGANLYSRSTPLAFVAEGQYWVNNHAHILKPFQGELYFWANLLETVDYTIYITGSAQPKLTQDALANIELPVPPIKEQQAIWRYLKDKLNEIDKLLSLKKELIIKLEQQRQSFIREAVTKGLNPNVKMKDSGVEWIGEIPEHWEVKPLYSLYNENKLKNKGNENKNVLSLSYGKIKRRDVESNYGLLPDSFETYQILKKGDIILRLTDLQNDKRSLRVGLVNEDGIITNAYLGLKQSNKSTSQYTYYLLHSYDLMKVFYGLGSGVRQSIGYTEMKKLPILLPPLEEQLEIIEFLKVKVPENESVIELLKKQIEKLKEYRQSLIYEAVTGKIDVRDMELD